MKNRGIIIAVIAVLAVGFLAVSCGGNIKRVQNGVFSDYDNTITIGKALENNSTLKGGKWNTVEMNGRDYVTYTVRLTGAKVQELLPESFPASYRSKPNYGSAEEFKLSKITSMSDEEKNQVRGIIKAKLNAYEHEQEQVRLSRPSPPYRDSFINYSGVIDNHDFSWNNTGKMNDDFLDPYLLTSKSQFISDDRVSNSARFDDYIYRTVTDGISSRTNPELGVKDGEFTIYHGPFASGNGAMISFSSLKNDYGDNTDFINALVRTRTKFYDWYVNLKLPEYENAMAEYENAMAEYEERQNRDIEPLLTIDGYEIILSFVMNQDDTFTTNMIEVYTDVTLNCFNNVKVRYNVANSSNADSILSYIYRGFTPNFF